MRFLLTLVLFVFLNFQSEAQIINNSIVQGKSQVQKVQAGINIYPNPAHDHFVIAGKEAVKLIEVYNIAGKLMKSYKVIPGKKYNVEQLQNGLYLVRFLDANNKVLAVSRLSKRR